MCGRCVFLFFILLVVVVELCANVSLKGSYRSIVEELKIKKNDMIQTLDKHRNETMTKKRKPTDECVKR